MKVLVTGISGYCGRHLAAYLAGMGHELHGVARRVDTPAASTLPAGTQLHCVDVEDPGGMRRCIDEVRPDIIFHLAALMPDSAPSQNPWTYQQVNVHGTLELIDAVMLSGCAPVVHVAGSGAIYAPTGGEPVTEQGAFGPTSPYALSKLSQDLFSRYAYTNCGLKTMRTRAFNLIGPGLPATRLIAAWAQQIAEIENERREPVLRVGRPETRLAVLDVRDAVRAYWQAAAGGEPGEVYNVCSGRTTTVRELSRALIALSPADIHVVEEAPELSDAITEAVETAEVAGDATRLRHRTGWETEFPLEQSLRDVLNEWRERLGKGGS